MKELFCHKAVAHAPCKFPISDYMAEIFLRALFVANQLSNSCEGGDGGGGVRNGPACFVTKTRLRID